MRIATIQNGLNKAASHGSTTPVQIHCGPLQISSTLMISVKHKIHNRLTTTSATTALHSSTIVSWSLTRHGIIVYQEKTPTHDMSSSKSAKYCVGSPSFNPSELIQDQDRQAQARTLLTSNDLYNATRVLFSLPEPDNFVYHATASVKLAQVQQVVNLGGANSLHAWYRGADSSEVKHSRHTIDPPIYSLKIK